MTHLGRFIVILFAGLLLAGCGRGHQTTEFPAIEDGKQLQLDCIRLLEQQEPREVPTLQWTKAIKALKPIRVVRNGDHIRIWLFEERGRFAGGYDVFSNTHSAPSTKGIWVEKTPTKGIYIFKMVY